ncbi:MAG: hypothetical protein LQ340_002711 [Diploschistes diacapsis]|nr:MAG: hypothetical protein LQ340_002711 [Diploschistes diacapsis]
MSSIQATRQLQEAVWKGSLPLQIRLSPTDCRVYDDTIPYYVHAPRLSYLPFLIVDLHAFFSPYLIYPSVSASSAWFSFEGVPLKWHHPIGLLYDLFSGASPALPPSSRHAPSTSAPSGSATALPWRLMVHYSAFPSDQMVQLDEEGKAFHDAFINSVKEADFLRNGTGNAIMKLSKDDSTALWDAVVKRSYSAYPALS